MKFSRLFSNDILVGKRRFCSLTDKVISFPTIVSADVKRTETREGGYYQIGLKRKVPSVTTVLKEFYNGDHDRQKEFAMETYANWFLNNNRPEVRSLISLLDQGHSKPACQRVIEIFMKINNSQHGVFDDGGAFGSKFHAVIDKAISSRLFLNGNRKDLNFDVLSSSVEGHSSYTKSMDICLQSFIDWYKNSDLILNPEGDQVVISKEYGYAGSLDCLARSKDGKDLMVLDFKTSQRIGLKHKLQVAAYSKAVEEMTGEKISKALVIRLNKTRRSSFEVRQLNVEDIDEAFGTFLSALNLFNYKKQAFDYKTIPMSRK